MSRQVYQIEITEKTYKGEMQFKIEISILDIADEKFKSKKLIYKQDNITFDNYSRGLTIDLVFWMDVSEMENAIKLLKKGEYYPIKEIFLRHGEV